MARVIPVVRCHPQSSYLYQIKLYQKTVSLVMMIVISNIYGVQLGLVPGIMDLALQNDISLTCLI